MNKKTLKKSLAGFMVVAVLSGTMAPATLIFAADKNLTNENAGELKLRRVDKNDIGKVIRKSQKANLSEPKKKLSTDLLRLIDDNFLLPNQKRTQVVSQMKELKQFIAKEDSVKTLNRKIENKAHNDLVYVYVKFDPSAQTSVIDSAVWEVTDRDEKNHLAVALVEVDKLETLASMNGVKNIRSVLPPVVHSGSVTTEGDAIHRTNDVRSAYSQSGAGIKIGVISDGVDNIASAQSTGDLPAVVTVLSNTNPFGAIVNDEGTAMLEIIHDMVPDADLYFHDCGNNKVAFNSAIDNLVAESVNVIVDDIGWITEPFFEDGEIALHIKNVLLDNDIIYVSSAGNSGSAGYYDGHYQGNYYNGGYNFHDFSRGSAPAYKDLYVKIPSGASVQVVLQWNDSFGSSGNDYDLMLINENGFGTLAESSIIQNGNDDPLERLSYTNTTGSTIEGDIWVYNYNGLAATKTLELFIYPKNGTSVYTDNITPIDSIFGHSAVPDVIAVGAIAADDSGNDTIEPFSSQGPVTIIGESQRAKPDVTGIDKVSVTGAGGFYTPFSGTSAAAPHIAAIAAQLWGQYPSATGDQIRNHLLNTAVDLGDTGFDNIFGHGRADALLASNSLAPSETEVSGNITEDTTWILANSPYIVTDTVQVLEDVKLTIEPGVTVKFNAQKSLNIDGELSVVGTVDNIITFTSNQTTPNAGDWDGIMFFNNAVGANFDSDFNYIDGSIIKYSKIAYARSMSSFGALDGGSIPLFIDNNIIEYSQSAAIYTNASGNKISNNIIQFNNFPRRGCDVAAVRANSSNNYITNNTVDNNGNNGISVQYNNNYVFNNVVTNNCNGIEIKGSNNIIENNIATSNFQFGISYIHSNLPMSGNIIKHNEIKENNSGVYLSLYNGGNQVEISYNNIYANNSHNFYLARNGSDDIEALNNYWGATDMSIIDSKIWDYYDDASLGKLDYEPFATAELDFDDQTAPSLSEKNPVPTPTNDNTPDYTFSSDEAGTITYGGLCTSATNSVAFMGENTITLDPLDDGVYDNCTITVTDAVGNASAPLDVSPFTVDTQIPEITLIGNNPVNLYVGDTYVEYGANATDNVGITEDIEIDSSDVDTGKVGTYFVTYNVSDSAGNPAVEKTRTVNVNEAPDITPPVLNEVIVVSPTVGSGETQRVYVNAEDDLSGIKYVAVRLESPTSIHNSAANIWDIDEQGRWYGDLTIPPSCETGTWRVEMVSLTDNTGNTKYYYHETDFNVTFTVTSPAVDTTPPVITLLGESTVNIFAGDIYDDVGATAYDNIDGDITNDIIVNSCGFPCAPNNTGNGGGSSCCGAFSSSDGTSGLSCPITYNVSDSAGNPAGEVTRTVIITDVKLESIEITNPATKLIYTVGDSLDITGLEITGTYNNGSTQIETITTANITGFDSSAPVADQILTITVGSEITTCTVDIIFAPDTTPPVRSNGSPTGTLSAGTTQTTLSLTTDENAICKYGTLASVPYGEMTDTFSSTDSTAHSQTITGLTNGSNYNYYVRCQDDSDNSNTNDYTISFSVASPSSGSSGGGGGGGSSVPPKSVSSYNKSLKMSSTQKGTLNQNLNNKNKIKVEVPKGSVKSTTTFTASKGSLENGDVPKDKVGAFLFNGLVFNVEAVDVNKKAVREFSKDLTITLTVPDLPDDTASLELYYYDEASKKWVVITDIVFGDNTITFKVNHLTQFALFETDTAKAGKVKGVEDIIIVDGDIIQCQNSINPFAVYIVKIVGDTKYIRHIVSLEIFNYYGHLKWENLKQVNSLSGYSLSGWVRYNTGPNNTVAPTDKVYEINGDQTKHWINMTADNFLSRGGSEPAIFNINQGELNLYTTGADVMSL